MRLGAVLFGFAMVVGGCGNAPAHHDARIDGPGPIGGQGEGVAYAHVARPGTVFTDGTGLLTVPEDKAAKILKVESIGGSAAMTYLGAKLAGPRREFTTSTSWPTWPPRIQGDPLRDAIGATVDPVGHTYNQNGYELLLGYRIDRAKYAVRKGVRITYQIGNKTYRAMLPLVIATCPPSRSLDACQEDASKVMQTVVPHPE